MTLSGQEFPPGPDILGEKYRQAAEHHLAGRLQDAESFYRQILQADPNHADALHMFGVLAHQLGHFQVAVECLGRAVAVRPHFAEAHYNLGNACKALGMNSRAAESYHQVLLYRGDVPEACFFAGNGFREIGDRDQAVACYRKAIGLNPGFAAALNALGGVLKDQGNTDAALEVYQQALKLQPGDAELLNSLGLIYLENNQLSQAEDTFRQGLLFKPDFPEVLSNLGLVLLEQDKVKEAIEFFERALKLRPDYPEALSNLGAAFQELGFFDSAIDRYTQALELKPDMPEIHSNMGYALQELGRLDAAVEQFQRALAIKPDYPEGLNNLGNVYKQQGRYAAAADVYHQALQLAPAHPEVHANMGALFLEQGQWDQAVAQFQRALNIRSDHPEAHLGLGLYHLLLGDLATGWRYYEWRWKTRNFIHHGQQQPAWRGERMAGQTLLLHCEQGFGDSIQFIRYIPMVREHSQARVVVFCPQPLQRLFATVAGIDYLTAQMENLPVCDCQAPLLSLPYLLGTTLENIPASVPYLVADAWRESFFRDRLQAFPGLKVGITWRGNPRHKNDRHRSMDPSGLVALCDVAGVCLVNLQKDILPQELAVFSGRPNFIDVSGMLHDFADTAAVLANLDLVLAVDTAVVHLAGAMGRRAWVMLPYVPDWRWMQHRDDSPWYPGLKLFRQQVFGSWAGCLERVVAALRLELEA